MDCLFSTINKFLNCLIYLVVIRNGVNKRSNRWNVQNRYKTQIKFLIAIIRLTHTFSFTFSSGFIILAYLLYASPRRLWLQGIELIKVKREIKMGNVIIYQQSSAKGESSKQIKTEYRKHLKNGRLDLPFQFVISFFLLFSFSLTHALINSKI